MAASTDLSSPLGWIWISATQVRNFTEKLFLILSDLWISQAKIIIWLMKIRAIVSKVHHLIRSLNDTRLSFSLKIIISIYKYAYRLIIIYGLFVTKAWISNQKLYFDVVFLFFKFSFLNLSNFLVFFVYRCVESGIN